MCSHTLGSWRAVSESLEKDHLPGKVPAELVENEKELVRVHGENGVGGVALGQSRQDAACLRCNGQYGLCFKQLKL